MSLQPKPVYIDTPDNITPDTTPTFQERNKEPRFRQKYPRSEDDYQFSNNSGVSLTIPNETYTIRELLNKHTSGIMPDVAKKEIWQEDVSHDSPDLQKLNRLDIVEKQIEQTRQTNIIEQLDEILARTRKQQDEQLKQAQAQSQKDESEATVEKGTAPSE